MSSLARATLTLRSLLALCLPALLLPACRGEGGGGDPSLSLRMDISPTPPGVGPARLIIHLDDAGAPVEGARIVVEGNMTHAGMTPVIDTARADAPGRYVVDGFRFTMGGDWILTLRATLPDGRWTEVRQDTRVARGPSGGDAP